jgi:hypothetical protein
MAKKQISNYKFFPGVVPPAYDAFPNTVSLLEANKSYIIEEALGYTDYGYNSPVSAPSAYPDAIAQLTNNKEFIKVRRWAEPHFQTTRFAMLRRCQ